MITVIRLHDGFKRNINQNVSSSDICTISIDDAEGFLIIQNARTGYYLARP
jgi:hypothetical protein